MRIGAMNHPMRDVVEEIHAFKALGFDFLDLTLEPARTLPDLIDVARVAAALQSTGLGAVGHTAWYLPIASPIPALRQAAHDELRRAFDVFARLGISPVNVHPDQRIPSVYPRDWGIEQNAAALAILTAEAEQRGLRLMVENLPGTFNRVDALQKVFAAAPSLGFHLDVGHANLSTPANLTGTLLDRFADRLRHVHFSDNKGGDADLHLPMGVGAIDWRWAVRELKRHGYDGTISLEVFSPDREYLEMSRKKVQKIWAES